MAGSKAQPVIKVMRCDACRIAHHWTRYGTASREAWPKGHKNRTATQKDAKLYFWRTTECKQYPGGLMRESE